MTIKREKMRMTDGNDDHVGMHGECGSNIELFKDTFVCWNVGRFIVKNKMNIMHDEGHSTSCVKAFS